MREKFFGSQDDQGGSLLDMLGFTGFHVTPLDGSDFAVMEWPSSSQESLSFRKCNDYLAFRIRPTNLARMMDERDMPKELSVVCGKSGVKFRLAMRIVYQGSFVPGSPAEEAYLQFWALNFSSQKNSFFLDIEGNTASRPDLSALSTESMTYKRTPVLAIYKRFI